MSAEPDRWFAWVLCLQKLTWRPAPEPVRDAALYHEMAVGISADCASEPPGAPQSEPQPSQIHATRQRA